MSVEVMELKVKGRKGWVGRSGGGGEGGGRREAGNPEKGECGLYDDATRGGHRS